MATFPPLVPLPPLTPYPTPPWQGPPGPAGPAGPPGTSMTVGPGTAAAPSITFAADTNTGLYNRNADELGFSTGGVERLSITSLATSGVLWDKGGQVFNVKAYGAKGDGTTDDTAAIQAAQAAASAVSGLVVVPQGQYLTTLAGTQLTGPTNGRGQIITIDGGNHKRAPWFSSVKDPPASRGSSGSILTAFDGDISKSQLQIEHRVTGAMTLGQPATGYMDNQEAAPVSIHLYTDSGYDSGAGGRTQLSAIYVRAGHAGNGDVTCFNAVTTASGTKAGATSFLANPAAIAYNGQVDAGANGVYLNPFELVLNDLGYDVAGIGAVFRLNRTVSTGALDTLWGGVRVQTVGTQPVDTGLLLIGAGTGGFRVGVDLAAAQLTTSGTWINAAMTLSQDQRIYFQASNTDPGSSIYRRPSSTGTTWLAYNSSLTALQFVVGNNSVAQLQNNLVTFSQSVVAPLYSWNTGAGAADVFLVRDAANTLAMRNLANPQTLRLFSTTDASVTNFERASFGWSGPNLLIATEGGGTGANNRWIQFAIGGTLRWSISAGAIIPGNDAGFDLGQTTARIRNAYTNGVSTFVKAGTPVDGDFPGGAINGLLAVDTTANKIWARVGGVWKGVVIA